MDPSPAPTVGGTIAPIVTLTLNPALDLSTTAEVIEPWRKIRCDDPETYPGGGGVNVARVVRELGGVSLAVVALGGHIGSQHADAIRLLGIPLRRVSIRACTRQNFAVTERSTAQQYRFVQGGARLSLKEWDRCLAETVDAATGAACVVASSSVPPGVPIDAFAILADRLADIDVPLIVDTSGPAFLASLRAPIRLIKPSLNELQRAVGRELSATSDAVAAARELISGGECKIMVVSLGAAGALVVERDGPSFVVHAPPVQAIGTSGAGDSMVAAMALELTRGGSLVEAAMLGVAAGTAAVLAAGTALCQRHEVHSLLTRITVTDV
jgi:6-phosphofructokinase 2